MDKNDECPPPGGLNLSYSSKSGRINLFGYLPCLRIIGDSHQQNSQEQCGSSHLRLEFERMSLLAGAFWVEAQKASLTVVILTQDVGPYTLIRSLKITCQYLNFARIKGMRRRCDFSW